MGTLARRNSDVQATKKKFVRIFEDLHVVMLRLRPSEQRILQLVLSISDGRWGHEFGWPYMVKTFGMRRKYLREILGELQKIGLLQFAVSDGQWSFSLASSSDLEAVHRELDKRPKMGRPIKSKEPDMVVDDPHEFEQLCLPWADPAEFSTKTAPLPLISPEFTSPALEYISLEESVEMGLVSSVDPWFAGAPIAPMPVKAPVVEAPIEAPSAVEEVPVVEIPVVEVPAFVEVPVDEAPVVEAPVDAPSAAVEAPAVEEFLPEDHDPMGTGVDGEQFICEALAHESIQNYLKIRAGAKVPSAEALALKILPLVKEHGADKIRRYLASEIAYVSKLQGDKFVHSPLHLVCDKKWLAGCWARFEKNEPAVQEIPTKDRPQLEMLKRVIRGLEFERLSESQMEQLLYPLIGLGSIENVRRYLRESLSGLQRSHRSGECKTPLKTTCSLSRAREGIWNLEKVQMNETVAKTVGHLVTTPSDSGLSKVGSLIPDVVKQAGGAMTSRTVPAKPVTRPGYRPTWDTPDQAKTNAVGAKSLLAALKNAPAARRMA